MRARFLTEGLDHFQPHEILELLLFYALPRRNTNEIAHRLIQTFGSLHGVLHADAEELLKVRGVGRSTAAFLTLLRAVSHQSELSRIEGIEQPAQLFVLDRMLSYVSELFSGCSSETCFLLMFDSHRRLFKTHGLLDTSVEQLRASPGLVMSAVSHELPHGLVLAHNHPYESSAPSLADSAFTEMLATMLDSTECRLYDHIIYASDGLYSYAVSGVEDSLIHPRIFSDFYC